MFNLHQRVIKREIKKEKELFLTNKKNDKNFYDLTHM